MTRGIRKGAPNRPALWVALFLLPLNAFGSSSIGAYVSPHLGYSWHQLKALQIEESFLSGSGEDQPLDPQPEVGSKGKYDGGGFTVGVSGGIRLFDLRLGLLYLWTPLQVDGTSRDYRYSSDYRSAVGEKYIDSGSLDFHRVLVDIHYAIPVWRFEVDLQTHIGAVLLGESDMRIGNDIEIKKGISGDLGLGLSFSAFDFLSVGVEGYFGFLMFVGNYKGVYGIVGGVGGFAQFSI